MSNQPTLLPALFEDLTDRQRQYVDLRMQGFSPYQANKRCGFERTYHAELEALPKIKAIMDAHYASMQQQYDVTQKQVVEGILEGIDICKLQADGVGVINGWEKLARICGLASPEKKEVQISIEGRMVQQQLEELPEHELLALVGKERQLDLLDADYEVETDG